MRSRSRSFFLVPPRLSLFLPPSASLFYRELAFSATAFFTARSVESYVPGYPHRWSSRLPPLFSAHRAFFSPLFLSLFLSPYLPRPIPFSLYLYFRPAREREGASGRREILRKINEPRVASPRVAAATRLPFRVFLTIDSHRVPRLNFLPTLSGRNAARRGNATLSSRALPFYPYLRVGLSPPQDADSCEILVKYRN